MDSMDSKFESLSALASKLDQKIDGLNEVISEFERKLKTIGLGVPCWTEGVFACEGARNVRRGGIRYIRTDGWDLGYVKYGDGWRVVVKEIACYAHADRVDGYGQHEHSHSVDIGDPIPLLKAPRHVRAAATGRFPELLRGLEVQGKKYIENIEMVSSSTQAESQVGLIQHQPQGRLERWASLPKGT